MSVITKSCVKLNFSPQNIALGDLSCYVNTTIIHSKNLPKAESLETTTNSNVTDGTAQYSYCRVSENFSVNHNFVINRFQLKYSKISANKISSYPKNSVLDEFPSMQGRF